MKKLLALSLIVLSLLATPALAATKKKTTAAPPKPPVYKAVAPAGYASIDWAKAPGVASFYKTPADNGTIDFLTRINLRKNQINFVLSPDVVVEPPNPNPTPADAITSAAAGDI